MLRIASVSNSEKLMIIGAGIVLVGALLPRLNGPGWIMIPGLLLILVGAYQRSRSQIGRPEK